MRHTLDEIAEGFEVIKRLRHKVLETTGSVEQRVASLRKAHEELVATSPQSACALGLDSLHFQVRLVTMELKSLRDMIDAVENHLYYECLYLHKSVQSYAAAEIADKSARGRVVVEREYPAYKHLDCNARYDFDITVGLHAQLVSSIRAMGAYCDEQATLIENEKGKSAQGLNIHSLVHSNTYVHALLRAKTRLFLQSLGAFNGHHGKYLRRIQDKAQLVLDAITSDVRLVGADATADPARASTPPATPEPDSDASERSSAPSPRPPGEPGASEADPGQSAAGDAAAEDSESANEEAGGPDSPESASRQESSSRLTDAQRERKRRKQRRLRERQKEKKDRAGDELKAGTE